ncbi:MAG: ABC transporter permease [Burkholderiales bacterium]|nr:ABC transporter permease [Burkholderiales bacterium]
MDRIDTSARLRSAPDPLGHRLLRWSNVLALLALLAAASLLSPYFLELRNVMNVLRGASVLCIVAVGMTLVILSRGVDLSAGSILGMAGATLALMAGVDPGLAIVAALAVGAMVGLVNGVLIAWLGLQPFIATLATLIAVRGLVYIVSDGANIIVRDPPAWFEAIGSGHLGPVPIPILVAAAVVIVFAFVLTQTPFGRHVYAVGANEEAARLYGVNVRRVKILVYVLSGTLAALASVIQVSRLTVAEPNAGQLVELDAIAATLIGGTTFDGGVGGIPGTVLGVLILAVLGNLLNLKGVSPFVQMVLQGAIIVIAVVVSELRQRRR